MKEEASCSCVSDLAIEFDLVRCFDDKGASSMMPSAITGTARLGEHGYEPSL